MTTAHTWAFRARFRRHAFGWSGTRTAIERLNEAVGEIEHAARSNPALAAEGAVLLLEKLSPAVSHIDSSSGALGNSTAGIVENLVPLIAAAQVPRRVREKWLERLFDAIQDDDPPYIESLGEHWGALCADPALASHWADQLLPLVRHVLADRRSGTYAYSRSGTLCHSALFHAGRHDELLALLALDPKPYWHDQQWAAIRVNSAGAALSQADFAMSKIAVNETYGGNLLRKAIDYFCHLAVAPGFLSKIEKSDKAFVASEYFPKMQWMSDVNDDIYDPAYTDMLRVAFTSEFGRGKLQDLVALLSGRNFETKEYEDAIAEESFGRLKNGILAFMNKTHFDRITMILRSAGFVTSNLIGGQNAVNFAYIAYLRGRAEKIPADDLERLVRRWYAMSMLRGRYSGSPESQFDFDIRQISSQGLMTYVEATLANELPESFWTGMLPQFIATSSIKSPYFLCYQAAQVKLGDRGFLSRDITATDLLLNRADVHHVYPRQHLKGLNHASSSYNQIGNFVIAQSEINIAIGAKAPEVYFAELRHQITGGAKKYGGLVEREELVKNLRMNCIPESMLDGEVKSYEAFLEERRKLMALKIKAWFAALG